MLGPGYPAPPKQSHQTSTLDAFCPQIWSTLNETKMKITNLSTKLKLLIYGGRIMAYLKQIRKVQHLRINSR